MRRRFALPIHASIAFCLAAITVASAVGLMAPTSARSDNTAQSALSAQSTDVGTPAAPEGAVDMPPFVVPASDPEGRVPTGIRVDDGAVPNFGWAEKGALARSGQPSPEGYRILRDKYNIRGVVNLREEDNSEEAVVKSLGMTYFHIPVPDDYAPSPQHVTWFFQFVRAMNRQGKAVLVHCKAGVGRTGTMVALYRLEQGHPVEHALREALQWGMSTSPQHSGREQLAAINEYAADLGRPAWFPPGFIGGRTSPYDYQPVGLDSNTTGGQGG